MTIEKDYRKLNATLRFAGLTLPTTDQVLIDTTSIDRLTEEYLEMPNTKS